MTSQAVRVTLSGVRSATHVVHAASYLRHLLDETDGPVVVGVLDTGTVLGRARVAEPDLARLLPSDQRLTVLTRVGDDHWPMRPGERRVLLSIGAPGIRAFARLVVAGRGRRPEVVVVDEGIGSYGDWRTRRDAYRRQGGPGPWPSVRAIAVASGNRILTDVRWSLYRERSGRWEVAAPVADEFRRLVGEPGERTRDVVYLTQPWAEVGVLSERTYAAHLAAVRAACSATGRDLVIRAHPNEDRARYAGFRLSAGTGPAELDPEVVSAGAVLGSNSTALLNLVAIHDTPGLRVAIPELAPLDRALGRRQRSLLDAFLPAAVPVETLAGALEGLAGDGSDT